MNWKNLFFISTVFWVAVFFVSNCTQQGGDEMADDASGEKITICPPPPGATPAEIQACEEIRNQIDGYKSFMAQSIVKVEQDPNYKHPSVGPILPPRTTSVNGEIVPWDSLQQELGLLRGFQVHISDFTNIVNYAKKVKRKSKGQKSVDSVYVMLAINPTKAGRKGYQIKYTDFYFQAVESGKNESSSVVTFSRPLISIADTSGFDDFPKPCPFSCPPGE